MPLEDLTGNRFISDLNETWPLGTDRPDAGDDHIRGIKNVLKRSFPNITGPVTLTQDALNRGSVPSGSVMLFWQSAAPVGWTRVAGITTTHGLRVVTSSTAGGTSGGSDDPILNDKVPSHSHAVNAVNTGSGSANHTHGGVTTPAGAHNHTYTKNVPSAFPFGNNGTVPPISQTTDYTSSAPDHVHGIYADGAAHVHTVPAHSTNANAGAANWTPRYMDVIVCRKD
jgi:hypothetical protein